MFFRRANIPWLAVVLGVLASLVAYRSLDEAERAKTDVEFARRCQVLASVIEVSLREHQESLYNLRDLIQYSTVITRAEFAGAASDIVARHPGIQALEWAERIPGAQRAAVEAAVRAEGYPDFEFSDRKKGPVLQRAPDRPEHFVVLYIEPYVGNKAALGFDLVSGITWPDLQRAAAANRLVASGRLPLITDGRSMNWGYLLELPVYQVPVPATPEARGEKLRGFVLGVFQLANVLEDAITSLAPQGADLTVIDTSAVADRQLLHYHASRLRNTPVPPPTLAEFQADVHHQVIPLQVAGHAWELHFRPAPEWLATQGSGLAATVLSAGLLGSLAIGLYLRSLQRRTSEVEKQVAGRTAELSLAHDQLKEDIRQREAMDYAIKASEARLNAILEYSPNSIFVKDLEGRYVLVNRHHALLWHRPASDFVGRSDHEVFPAPLADMFRDEDQKVLASNTATIFEVTFPMPGDGREATAIVHKFPLRDVTGRVYGICGISTDISERRRAELELQENRRQLSTLISQLPGTAFRCRFDEHLTALFASEGMLGLTGYPAGEFTSGRRHLADLTLPADRAQVRAGVAAAIRGRNSFEIEYRILHREGAEKWVLVRGRPVYDEAGALRFLEGLAIDVTALKRAEAEKLAFERNLLETQKLESLGVLAGGIAHDFNNLLTAVLGNASLARATLGGNTPGLEHLEQIEQAARRAADLCQQMLAYAGKGRLAAGRLDLSELVRDTTSLLEVSVRKNCTLTLQLADALPAVLGDSTQLRQIVMNLVINASDAIGERAGGRIELTTFVRPADPLLFAAALHKPKLAAGTYVGLEVRDNGCGMPPETIARIFEPFFTTKFSGRGLGLSAVLGIVQSHRGALFVESQPGLGSTFRLLLPAEAGAADPAACAKPADPAQTLRGTVLVVDDEDAVRAVAGAVLRRHGAEVVSAANGTEALEVYRQRGAAISLMLLDLTMPGLSGEDVLRELQKTGAPLRVVVMSGYSEEETMRRCAELGAVDFLRKPFELQAIVDKVRKHLA